MIKLKYYLAVLFLFRIMSMQAQNPECQPIAISIADIQSYNHASSGIDFSGAAESLCGCYGETAWFNCVEINLNTSGYNCDGLTITPGLNCGTATNSTGYTIINPQTCAPVDNQQSGVATLSFETTNNHSFLICPNGEGASLDVRFDVFGHCLGNNE